ncbi:MAG: hypothetical protein ACR2QC_07600, partial [Gammaproteobacteria bacterium]
FAGMELKRFRLSPEWRILIKRLKVPPFRRKFILANAGTGISFTDSPQSGDNLRLRRRRFRLSPEWDGWGEWNLRDRNGGKGRNGTVGEAAEAGIYEFWRRFVDKKSGAGRRIVVFCPIFAFGIGCGKNNAEKERKRCIICDSICFNRESTNLWKKNPSKSQSAAPPGKSATPFCFASPPGNCSARKCRFS